MRSNGVAAWLVLSATLAVWSIRKYHIRVHLTSSPEVFQREFQIVIADMGVQNTKSSEADISTCPKDPVEHGL